MVKIRSPAWAEAFKKKVLQGAAWPDDAPFYIAVNDSGSVEVRAALIEIIDQAQHNLIIEHAYFSTDKIVAAVKRAAERGVKVNVILPEEPDTHIYANWVTINELLKSESDNPPHIFLFPKMMHAKVILVDGAVAAVGSANLTLRSMLTSRETTLFFHGESDHPFITRLRQQLVEDMIESREVEQAYEMGFFRAFKAKVDKYVW
jgi:cardiolipin synthase